MSSAASLGLPEFRRSYRYACTTCAHNHISHLVSRSSLNSVCRTLQPACLGVTARHCSSLRWFLIAPS